MKMIYCIDYNITFEEVVWCLYFCLELEYASTIWSLHTDKNIESIEMVQRRAARWVSNQYSSYDSVTAMLSNLGLLLGHRAIFCFNSASLFIFNDSEDVSVFL